MNTETNRDYTQGPWMAGISFSAPGKVDRIFVRDEITWKTLAEIPVGELGQDDAIAIATLIEMAPTYKAVVDKLKSFTGEVAEILSGPSQNE